MEAEITAIACSEAPDGSVRWTANLINDRLIKLDIHNSRRVGSVSVKKSKPPGGPVKPWLKKQCGPACRCIGQIDGKYLAKMEDVLSVYGQAVQVNRVRICFDERPCQLLDDVVAPCS